MSKDSKEPLASKLCAYLGKRPSNPLPPAVVDWAFVEARRHEDGRSWPTLRAQLEAISTFLMERPAHVDDKTRSVVWKVQGLNEDVAKCRPHTVALLGQTVFPYVQLYLGAWGTLAQKAGTLTPHQPPHHRCPPWVYQTPPETFPYEALHPLIHESTNPLTQRALERTPALNTPEEHSLWRLFCEWLKQRHGLRPRTKPHEVLDLHTAPWEEGS